MTHGDFNNHNLMEIHFCFSYSIVKHNYPLTWESGRRANDSLILFNQYQKSLLNQLTCKSLYISISINHLFVIDFKIPIKIPKFKCVIICAYADVCKHSNLVLEMVQNWLELVQYSDILEFLGNITYYAKQRTLYHQSPVQIDE